MSGSSQQALAAELATLGYVDLFMRADTEHQDRLWNRPNGSLELEALAVGPGVPWEARFLAAEVLFRKQAGFPRKDQRDTLAPAYVEALRNASMANPWGLPGELDGSAGQHLVSLGEGAAVELAGLLDDARRLPYWGSQEATWGNSFAFRVKDFAAFFLSVIRGQPYLLHTDPDARDADIRKLARSPP
ncbi:MAG: hypothetical protein KDI53_18075 [Candidatus Accumulibacter sp.]|nr:hypothetical protein [Accumulibacter sp.]